MSSELLDRVRSFIEAQPVVPHEVPPWFVVVLKAFVIDQQWDLDWSSDTELCEEILTELCPSADWFINWGTSEGNFVAEPYEFNAATAASLDKLCSTLGGLAWKVGSDAWSSPGKAVRITIYPT